MHRLLEKIKRNKSDFVYGEEIPSSYYDSYSEYEIQLKQLY